ncbi:Gfo/Idh/MocA family protein [Sphingobacterium hungaricum]|uniref:Oxidoreductase n=1 Tax=Sphingobacterium hungaricum TaxID=2082723 RepID=A0A928UX60_9SPHI|nr:Gfo/Idh/MocA family oxidoreductase [Sphingobacterium hungaricum]MBE8714931.1 oxidoreductase [Sphingobacterium hungaricum]
MFDSRREFIKNSSLLLASAGLSSLYSTSFAGPQGQKIRIGAIGIKGMGWSNLSSFLKLKDVECVAICDIDQQVIDDRLKELATKNIRPKVYHHHKDLLADQSIDAVIIGTPDHWHCLQMIDACAAGKHVYVEKPLGNSIVECDAMLAAKNKYNSIVQVGQWQRSQQHFKDAIDFVHSGKLGKIRIVKAWSYLGWKHDVPVKPDTAPPAGVDYQTWLGPAKTRPFNLNRFHFEFRWFWDYAGGLMTDWGVHLLDYALLGMKVDTPKSIIASGGKFAYPNDASETPDTLSTAYEFDDFTIQWEHTKGIGLGPYSRDHGIAFIGNNGTLVLNRNGWEVIPESNRMEAVSLKRSVDNGLDKHTANFVEAIQTRNASILAAPIEVGAHIAKFSQMGNIAYRTGKKLHWDKAKNRFHEKEANEYLAAKYYNNYKIPKIS